MSEPFVIAVAATFTTDPFDKYLNFWATQLNLTASVKFAHYNQIYQQLLDPTSLFANNSNGINLILIRFADWVRDFGETKTGSLAALNQAEQQHIEAQTAEFILTVKTAARNQQVPQIICICPSDTTANQTLFEQCEHQIQRELASIANTILITSAALVTAYPAATSFDSYTDKLGHLPFTEVGYCAIATMIARKIYKLIRGADYKVIVLGCDQTLWQGNCGGNEPANLVIDPQYQALQQFFASQYKAGMMLCLCSKNNEDEVIDVFAKHQQMSLKLDYISARRINWQSKSANLKELAAELQLPLSSFIFIDDSAAECTEVATNCAEVLALQLPVAEKIPDFLNNLWLFDR